MKTSKLTALAVAAALAAPMAATAGNQTAPTMEQDIVVLPTGENVPVGSLRGSLDNNLVLGGIALLLLGAAAAGGGS